ncbi:MAG: hypothetical protein ACR2LI_03500 [Propionibacteriaceae bacterium]
MSEPSTAGLHDAVVGDDLRDVGVPMLLFTPASLAHDRTALPRRGAEPDRRLVVAAEVAGVDLEGPAALFGTDAYLRQRALGEIVLGDA